MPKRDFTPEEQKIVDKEWHGHPPKECVGNCNVGGVEYSICAGCGWHEEF